MSKTQEPSVEAEVVARVTELKDVLTALHTALAFDQLLSGAEARVSTDRTEVFRTIDAQVASFASELSKQRAAAEASAPKDAPAPAAAPVPEAPKATTTARKKKDTKE